MTVLQACRSNSEVATGFATSKDRFATGRASAEPRYDTRASRVIPNKAQNTILSRRNNSTVRAANELPRWGVRAWGDAIMTEIGEWKERRDQVARYRVLEEETTDPLAASLLHDIILEMEADLRQATEVNEQEIAARDLALEPGVIEFYGRTISCLVRNLSETGCIGRRQPLRSSPPLYVGAPVGRDQPSLPPCMAEGRGDGSGVPIRPPRRRASLICSRQCRQRARRNDRAATGSSVFVDFVRNPNCGMSAR